MVQQGISHNAGAGNAGVDHDFRFAHAVECSGHEGVILGNVAEDNELGAAEAAVVGGEFRRFFDDLTHCVDGVHVDARFGGTDVHRGAYAFRFRQRLRNAFNEFFVGLGHAFVNEGGETSEEVYAHFFGGAVQRFGEDDIILTFRSRGGNGDRSYGDAFIDDGDAEIAADLFPGLYEILCLIADLIVDLFRGFFRIGIGAVHETDPHGDGADIEIFVVDHMEGF